MMTRYRAAIVVAAAVSAAVAAVGCGTHPANRESVAPGGSAVLQLDTSASTAAGTWAVAVMGGSAARHNNFWQLFARSPGATRWRLATPPGTADNGGLVLASGSGRATVTAFRPSQYLKFTPLIQSTDSGVKWAALSPLDGALASTPDALAEAPGGAMLALLDDGTVTVRAHGWRTLVTRRTLAATPYGRRCGLTRLTAAVYSPSGTLLVGGTCARSGAIAIFADRNGSWHHVSVSLHWALAGRPITVLRLTRAGHQLAALLAVGSGTRSSVIAAWSPGGRRWRTSRPLAAHSVVTTSAFLGMSGRIAVRLADGQGLTIEPGRGWQPLPSLPHGTVTLAAGSRGTVDALAVDRIALTVWRIMPGTSAWVKNQVIKVPVQYGSSG